ncbi:recombinase family protein [Streptomyces sp. NPDC048196]|uniref:recombinase family protein n=1 Tax=Streptomyces sp. NPDC048196 TaxID=3154712 RepID=UPI0033E79D1E
MPAVRGAARVGVPDELRRRRRGLPHWPLLEDSLAQVGAGDPHPRRTRAGRAWEPGPEPDLAVGAALARAGDRIGFARVSSKGQDLAGQVRFLKKANCVRIFVEKIGIREKIRPEYNEALADLRPADTLTATMLDRLGRNMVELITCAQDLAERDHRMEILGGPLAGMYDPQGAGKVVFAVFAAKTEVEREFIHERTLIGLDTAAADGNHGGRPPAVDGDMLAVALRRRDANEPVTTIARHLGVGRSTLYRTLAAYGEAAATLTYRSSPPDRQPAGSAAVSDPAPTLRP